MIQRKTQSAGYFLWGESETEVIGAGRKQVWTQTVCKSYLIHFLIVQVYLNFIYCKSWNEDLRMAYSFLRQASKQVGRFGVHSYTTMTKVETTPYSECDGQSSLPLQKQSYSLSHESFAGWDLLSLVSSACGPLDNLSSFLKIITLLLRHGCRKTPLVKFKMV